MHQQEGEEELSEDVWIVLKQAELSRAEQRVRSLRKLLDCQSGTKLTSCGAHCCWCRAAIDRPVLLILCKHVLCVKMAENQAVELVWHTSSLDETRAPLQNEKFQSPIRLAIHEEK